MSLSKLNLPIDGIYKQFMPKNQFYENSNFTRSEKDIFINCIDKITLYSQLTRENTNISIYKDDDKSYREVSVILIDLRKKDNIERIAKLVMESIPYPMILIGSYEEEYIFYGSHIKDNKTDSSRVILEKSYNTDYIKSDSKFIENINYRNLSKVNFYKFYSDYINEIINFNLEKRNIKGVKDDNKEVLEEIENLEQEIISLKNKMKKERQFNRKMDLNIKRKKLEEQLEKNGGIRCLN